MALYHTYRPQTFADVIDQEHVVTTLKSQIILGKLAHAYLFSGPRGIGKTTTARILAKAINCKTRATDSAEPCGTCDACRDITDGRSIDVIEIDAASHTGVDHVREQIIENAQFKPTSLRYKIFIIDEVHMLSTSAFNALLKTLEEPPAHVMFILATTELHKIPETILSRCQRFHFRKIPYDNMKKHLTHIATNEGIEIEENVLDRVIVKSDGCARDAVSLLDQLMASGAKKITRESASLVLPQSNREDSVRLLTALAKRDSRAAFENLGAITDGGTNLAEFADDLVRTLRLMIVMRHAPQSAAETADMSDSMRSSIVALEPLIHPREMVALIDLILRRRQDMRSSPIPELPLEMAIIEWCTDEPAPRPAAPAPAAPAPTPAPSTPKEPLKPISQPAPAPTPAEPANNITPPPAVAIETPPTPAASPAEAPAAAPSPSASSALDMTRVTAAWKQCTKQLETTSPSVASVLRGATLTALNGDTIVASVAFAFYRDVIMGNKEQQRKIEQTLSKELGTTVHIDITVDAPPPEESEDSLQDVTAVFGGQVVG